MRGTDQRNRCQPSIKPVFVDIIMGDNKYLLVLDNRPTIEVGVPFQSRKSPSASGGV